MELRHLTELKDELAARNIPLESICVVGGGILTVKGIRMNNDIDFLTLEEPMRTELYAKKTHEKYFELTENVDCYFDRYREIGINDAQIFNKKLYFEHGGIKFVIPEIEIAYKIFTKNIDEKKRAQLESYIADAEGWDWDLFKDLLMYHNTHKVSKSVFMTRMRHIKWACAALFFEPKKVARFAKKKLRSSFSVQHKIQQSFAGQLHTKMATSALFGNHALTSDYHRYDVLLRYLTIRELMSEDGKMVEQYKKMQEERGSVDTTEDFRRLVKSINVRGFSNDFPIPVATNGRIVEGAHRLASALYFGVDEVPVEIASGVSGGYYGKKWFVDKNFDDSLLKKLDSLKNFLYLEKGIYFPIMIWSPAKEHFNAIAQEIKNQHVVVFEKELTVTGDFSDFVDDVYSIDNIAKWKVGLKKHLMKEKGTSFYLMLLEVPDPMFRLKPRYQSYLSTKMEKLKRGIRGIYCSKIDNYFYDIILHTGDNYEHNKKILDVIYSHTALRKEDIV